MVKVIYFDPLKTRKALDLQGLLCWGAKLLPHYELVGQNCNFVKSRILCLRFINITIIPLNTVLVNRFLKSFCKIIETLSYYFLYLMYKTLGSREENQS